MNTFPSKFISAYRKSYNTNHVLEKVTRWEKNVGSVTMNLLKVFYSIPHGLIIAKMYIFYLGFTNIHNS